MLREQPDFPISHVALVLEGGGMRAAHTAGIIASLIEHKVWFPYVCGLSAGSSNATNYIARDVTRARTSFVDIVHDKRFGGIGSFMRHQGFFNSEFLYEQAMEDGTLSLDWDVFCANPTKLRIQAFERDTGRTVTWTKDDMASPLAMARRVRASSTLPFMMNPVTIDGQVMLDGGLGDGAGIPLTMAQNDGYTRFVVITTRERGYRKKPMGRGQRGLMRRLCTGYPHLFKALETRSERYNAELDNLAALEASGNALVIYPEHMPIHNTETHYDALLSVFTEGHERSERDLPDWLAWIKDPHQRNTHGTCSYS